MNQTITDMKITLGRRPTNEPLVLLKALRASDGVYGDDFIQFKVKGDRDVNKIKVIYNYGQDLYDVEFYNQRGLNCNMKDKIEGLYNDQLVDAIWRRVVLV